MSWERVSRANPCEICGRPDWCMVASDGTAALCMRDSTGRAYTLSSGEVGFIFRLLEMPRTRTFVQRWQPPREVPRDVVSLYNQCLKMNTTTRRLQELAVDLGVKYESVTTISGVGAAWFPMNNAWGFPMMDGGSHIVGVRLRNSRGEKWAITGSHSGIFYAAVSPPKTVYIVEGPTDTAAGLSCGMFTIGRPSCSGGGPQINHFLKLHPQVKEVVIIADNDEPKQRNGGVFYPGREGAERLQKMLPIKSCIITLPCKDLRQFYANGCDASSLELMIRNTVWFNPSVSGRTPATC